MGLGVWVFALSFGYDYRGVASYHTRHSSYLDGWFAIVAVFAALLELVVFSIAPVGGLKSDAAARADTSKNLMIRALRSPFSAGRITEEEYEEIQHSPMEEVVTKDG